MRINELLSYKEICEEMNDTIKSGGKNRKEQLLKWQKLYDIEKIKTKYIIKRSLTIEEREILESDGKFATYIQNLLVWLLKQQNNYELRIGYKELFEYMKMVNERYYVIKYKEEKVEYTQNIAQDINVNIESIENNLDTFYRISNKFLKDMMRRALNSMQKRGLIIYCKSYRMFKKIYIKEINSYVVDKHDCSIDEVSEIMQFYVETMKKFNIKEYNHINVLPDILKREFYHQIDEKIFDKFGYDYHREVFRIILSKGIEYELMSSTQQRLNQNVQTGLKGSSDIRKTIPPTQLEIFIKDLISL